MERRRRANGEEFVVLNKEDSKIVMKTKEFETFINKTSKIVERALTGAVDVFGASMFLEEISGVGGDGEIGQKSSDNLRSQQHRERLVPMFTFQDNEPTLRTITSIEWSPKVS